MRHTIARLAKPMLCRKSSLLGQCFVLLVLVSFSSGAVWAATATATTSSPVSSLHEGAKITPTSYNMRSTANFGNCLQPKIKVCFEKCGFIPVKLPGIQFKYREPTALVETSCRHGKTQFANSGISLAGVLSGSLGAPNEQDCVKPLRDKHGTITRYYHDVHTYNITPLGRYATSGSPGQVTWSLSCGIFGMVGKLMSFANLANFDFSSLNPANMVKNISDGITNGIQNLTTSIASIPTNIANTIQNIPGQIQGYVNSIASLPSDLGNQLSSLQSSLANASTLNLSNLNTISGNLSNLGDSLLRIASIPGASFIPGMESLAAAGSAFATAGGLGVTAATGLANIDTIGDQLNQAINEGVTNLNNFVTSGLEAVNAPLAATYVSSNRSAQSASRALNDADMAVQMAYNTKRAELSDAGAALLSAPVSLKQAGFQIASIAVGTGGSGYGTGGVIIPGGVNYKTESGYENTATLFSISGDLQSGASQLALKAGQSLYEGLNDTLNEGVDILAKRSTELAGVAASSSGSHCSVLDDLYTMRSKIASIQTSLAGYNVPEVLNKGPFVAQATYLPYGYLQELFDDVPPSSCPLTFAGYVYVPADNSAGYARDYVNCHYVTGGDGGSSNMHRGGLGGGGRWVPNDGYAGDCETNMISKVSVDGLYPSCNGYCPAMVSDDNRHVANYACYPVQSKNGVATPAYMRMGNIYWWLKTNKVFYNEQYNHVRKLNQSLVNNLIASASRAKVKVDNAIARLEPLAKQTPGGCAAGQAGTMLPSTSFSLVSVAAVDPTQDVDNANNLILPTNITPYSKANAKETAQGVAPLNEGAGISSVMQAADKADAILRSPGTFAMNYVNKMLPSVGLVPVFMSENLPSWSTPPFSITSAITNSVNTLAATTPLVFACTLPQAASDVGIKNNTGLQSFTKNYCAGTWGLIRPYVGWAYNQYEPVAAALNAKRGQMMGVTYGGIQPDVSGQPEVFNSDYPQIYNQSEYAQSAGVGTSKGGRHKGSKCYEVGTSRQGWFTAGEGEALATSLVGFNSPANTLTGAQARTKQAEAGKGHYVFSWWKNTSCCITPCGVQRMY